MLLALAGFEQPAIHLILSPGITILLLLAVIIYSLAGWRIAKRVSKALSYLTEDVNDLPGYNAANIDALAALATATDCEALSEGIACLRRDAIELHDGKWLPDPAPVLAPDNLLTPLQENSLSLRPAVSVFLIGLAATLASLITQVNLPLPAGALNLLFTFAPVTVGLAGGLLLALLAVQRRGKLRHRASQLQAAINRRVPTLGSQTGLAALVNAFLESDRQMAASLDSFNQTASRIAESEMAAGIQHSVERVLMETVAPTIAEANQAVTTLAADVVNRQDRGMQDMAVRFASALSEELASHLEPIYSELSKLTPLMSDVKQYVDVALRSLQTARGEADALARQTDASIGVLAQAREAFSQDSSTMSSEISRLAEATASMANVYAGNEQSLTSTVNELNQQMSSYAQGLAGLVAESSRALREAQITVQNQSTASGQYIADMNTQVSRLTEGLQQEIGLLLQQMRQETGQLTLQSTGINQRFQELNALLDQTGQQFGQASTRYVTETLQSFDNGLAEVVSRLANAANEIRDAVDALPQALRSNNDFQ